MAMRHDNNVLSVFEIGIEFRDEQALDTSATSSHESVVDLSASAYVDRISRTN
jgi:hypothetical protein